MSEQFTVRRATETDAEGIPSVVKSVAAERIYSAIDLPWTLEQERTYLRSLSPREATQVAILDSGEIIGFQKLDFRAAFVDPIGRGRLKFPS